MRWFEPRDSRRKGTKNGRAQAEEMRLLQAEMRSMRIVAESTAEGLLVVVTISNSKQ